MTQQKEKAKITTSRETGYPLYEDGRHTFSIRIEENSNRLMKGKDLGFCFNKGYTTMIGPLNLKDLKALRKLIRKAIKTYEDNQSFQI